ncbi:MAG: peptide chain release factor 1 [Desulfobacterales bacterium CG23_combo_of_CG06-09_8_20_14_all_51_8]|nr:MAG: peptide chain release factor 1 [Desulfobacterales bacterium CG23_combo_of_CG06-09_8_20_14_all_51_8]
MFDQLSEIEDRYQELEQLLSDPAIVRNRELYTRYVREHSDLGKIVSVFRIYRQKKEEREASRELLSDSDPEIKQLARSEVDVLSSELDRLEEKLKQLLIPKDPNDDKNVLLEIRAGTGGEEAALFAGDLIRMYSRYAETAGWKMELLSENVTDSKGFKEIIVLVKGAGVFSRLKYESGTHRVQRVPATETQGRIHTSAVTVAVLPEAEEVEVHIDPGELKFDVFRSSGPGGQCVNTTDSAVRVTHLPTGMVVICQDEKSQHKNKAKALKVLRARLYDMQVRQQQAAISENRKNQVGSGDRSERIRTYNYPQGRVTDHRIGLTLYRLDSIMQGDISELIDGLNTFYQTQALKHAEPRKSA